MMIKRGHSTLRARPLWLAAVAALVAAALLVAYLQRRDAAEQRALTALISRQVCERTAALLAGRLRQQFEAAIVETIEGIDHSYLREARLPKVAPGLAAGLDRHPYVERFFLWNERFPVAFRDQVLFYAPPGAAEAVDIVISGEEGEPLGGLKVDGSLGRELLGVAHSPQFLRRSLILVEREVDGVPYQIVMHTYGAVAWPEDTPGIIGYTVNLAKIRGGLLGDIASAELARVAPGDLDAPRLQLTVRDETGAVVYGPPVPADTPLGSGPVDLAFYTFGMPARWAGSTLPVPRWTLIVSAVPIAAVLSTQDYLFAAVLALILVALGCAVAVNRQSARLSRMHVDFVANVTHQLKTPLSLLSAATETMQMDRCRAPDKMREYAALVNNQTLRLTNLVERILRLSRIDADATLFERQRVDLARLARTSLERFNSTSKTAAVSFRFEGPDEGVPVEGDATALDDVLVNLLENAAKYTARDGAVTVRVDRSAGAAIVSVRDNGQGIHPDDLPHIFEKFYRGRSSESSVRGFGVGLAIVRSIVEAHGGRIRVDSTPGTGSEFEITLPLLQDPV